MTESKNAVFLSYAAEDSAPAQRLYATLRAADIEVWFDQSELRGGDAWVQKTRREIRGLRTLYARNFGQHAGATRRLF